MILLLQFLILAFILIVLLHLAWRAIHLIEPGHKLRKALLRYFPLAEFALWLWLIFRGAGIVFKQFEEYNIIINFMAIALVAAVAWYLLRDFLAGMVLKTENSLEKGQFLITEIASGTILSLGYRSMVIETDNGEKIRIPYSRLNKLLLTTPPQEDSSHSHVVEILVERNQTPDNIKKNVTGQLLNMPWVVAGFAPQVTVVVKDERHFRVQMRFNVLKKDHVIMVEENIKRHGVGGSESPLVN